MAVALKLLGGTTIGGQTRIQVQITLAGNYATFVPGPPASGGDAINFTSLLGQGLANSPFVFTANSGPIYGVVQGSTGDDYDVSPGSSLTNSILVVNTASNTQLGAGGYPARMTGDLNLFGEFVFQALQ